MLPKILPEFKNQKNMNVGLLGGSFNPAHEGHLHISLEAYKRLNLDYVSWLVSPQNPLKSEGDMAPFVTRFQSAQKITKNHRNIIHVSDIETKLRTRYTADTIKKLQYKFPHINFIWLMGADNLASFHLWQGWQDIAAMLPIAVLHRNPIAHHALRSQAANYMQDYRIDDRDSSLLVHYDAPAWIYLAIPPHPACSTKIREKNA